MTLKQAPFLSFYMISFLESFGDVIVASNFEETKGYI